MPLSAEAKGTHHHRSHKEKVFKKHVHRYMKRKIEIRHIRPHRKKYVRRHIRKHD